MSHTGAAAFCGSQGSAAGAGGEVRSRLLEGWVVAVDGVVG